MLSVSAIDSFVQRDTATVVDALVGSQLLGTDVGDRVLAQLGNYPDRRDAVLVMLAAHGIGTDGERAA